MAKTRIMLITVRADIGGGPKHIYDLACVLTDEFIIDIACPKQEPYWEKFSSIINGTMIEIPFRKFSIFKANDVLSHVKENSIDVIHSHGKGAGVYGRYLSFLSGVPLVHTPHGLHIGNYGPITKKLYLSYEKITSTIDNCTIYVSDAEKKEAVKLGIANKKRRVVVKNGTNSIPTAYAAKGREKQRKKLGIEANNLVVVSLSRFDYPKNMMDMAKIALSVKQAEHIIFYLVGDGPDLIKTKEWCKKNNLNNVFFPGFSNTPQEYLLASDIYLSTSRWEGLPLSIIESMAIGLPVLATDVVGNNEAVEHNYNGYLFPLGENEIAAKLLLNLADSPTLRNELGHNGRLRQRNCFSIEKMASDTAVIYNSLDCSESK